MGLFLFLKQPFRVALQLFYVCIFLQDEATSRVSTDGKCTVRQSGWRPSWLAAHNFCEFCLLLVGHVIAHLWSSGQISLVISLFIQLRFSWKLEQNYQWSEKDFPFYIIYQLWLYHVFLTDHWANRIPEEEVRTTNNDRFVKQKDTWTHFKPITG